MRRTIAQQSSRLVARALLAEQQRVPLEAADLALDFVETEIGANFFLDNWSRLKRQGQATARISAWLRALGVVSISAETIVQAIDALAATGTQWLTPFTSRIPDQG